ncbi:hypothetical protein PSPO01_09105 [Paraphaeosphaeria sporulosa]
MLLKIAAELAFQTSFKSTGRSARQCNPCVPTPLRPVHPCFYSAEIPFWAAFATASIVGPWPGLGLVDEAQVEVQVLGSAAGNRRAGGWCIFPTFLGHIPQQRQQCQCACSHTDADVTFHFSISCTLPCTMRMCTASCAGTRSHSCGPSMSRMRLAA